jgi:hypothetical protein
MRLAFSGVGGVGKSTLVYAMRDIWPDHFGKLTLIDSVRHPDCMNVDQKQRQSFLNKSYRENQLMDDFISSRSIYDVYSYSRQTVGLWFESVQWMGVLKKVQYDYLFYIPIEFELKPNEDSTRPLDRIEIDEFQTELQIVLNFYHVPVIIISGSIEDRLMSIALEMGLPNDNIRKYYKGNEKVRVGY